MNQNRDKLSSVILCSGCDLLIPAVEPAPGNTLSCPRCGKTLYKKKKRSIEKTLAVSLTGLLLYLPANFMPLITFDILGMKTSASLFTSSLSMFSQGQNIVGSMILLYGFFFPLFLLALYFSVSFAIAMSWKHKWIALALKSIYHLREWAMPDVYLIGVFVTIIKMSKTASVEFNAGLFCFMGLVLTTIGCQAVIDKRLFWSKLEPDGESFPGNSRISDGILDDSLADYQTGIEAGLCLCHACEKVVDISTRKRGLLNQKTNDSSALPLESSHNSLTSHIYSIKPIRCPRCGEYLHIRKQDSINRTWALLVTAILLILPANLLPIMEVDYFGVLDQSTIMDGIVYFIKEGSYGIGAIIFTASILVPVFKITGLLLILITCHLHPSRGRRPKAIMLRFIGFIGRWSMLDLFVISLLCALVRFGFFSTINASSAVFYFAGVVICTMLAAISFDPRLLWDTDVKPRM